MNGSELIAVERDRQINEELYTSEKDDLQTTGQLAMAAACYVSPELLYTQTKYANGFFFADPWSWKREQGEPVSIALPNNQLPVHKRIDLLVKAGALIAAEIDRLQRSRVQP